MKNMKTYITHKCKIHNNDKNIDAYNLLKGLTFSKNEMTLSITTPLNKIINF